MTLPPLSDARIAEIIAEVEAMQAQAIGPSQRGACCDCCGRVFPKPYGVPTTCPKCLEEL